MLNKFSKFELAIVVLSIVIIFISEYYYIVLKNHDRAIFIGLWPPTMISLLAYLNSKKQLIMENLDLFIMTILVAGSFFGLGFSKFKAEKKARENRQ